MSSRRIRHHGTGYALGCDHLRLGSFSKLFPSLKARESSTEDAREDARELGDVGRLMHDADGSAPDCTLPAGYAFLAQLLDHDMILGTEISLDSEQLPEHKLVKLANLRSPSLDLHCLYGLGPGASPHLYDPDEPGCLASGHDGNPDDLARTSRGLALIGDPRNDENLLISQLHLLFIRFANRIYRSCRDAGVASPFTAAQAKARHHYQYVILHDLLKRICAPDIYEFALDQLRKGKYPAFYQRDGLQSFSIPIELAGAVFRFGHTLLRSRYSVNAEQQDIDLLDLPMIDPEHPAVPRALVVDWRRFFELDDTVEPNRCKAFDLRYCDGLIRRPGTTTGTEPGAVQGSLAYRDLLRCHVLGAPEGPQVAAALKEKGYPIDAERNLDFHSIEGWTEVDNLVRRRLLTAPPLLFYVLREAQTVAGGEHLGPVGSAVMLEVILGILSGCKTSFLNPKWKFALDPEIAPRTNALGEPVFQMPDLIRYAEGA